ncbi:MAG: DUF134 domain-containing protein [Bacillota bacterium]|jgi:predicted DNA-binding protein (UPF0251 family)
MPRPQKCRRICNAPERRSFHSEDGRDQESVVEITLEEFETIRLIDYEGMTQEECAAQMLVARTTVQRIYNAARKKLAVFMLEGGSLRISGGNYEICGNQQCRGQKHCCSCIGRDENGNCNPDACPYV